MVWNRSRNEEEIKIDQGVYVLQILKDHGRDSVKAVNMPLPRTADVFAATENEELLNEYDQKKYRSIAGSLLYLVICTRLDITFYASVLARQLHAPTTRDLDLGKRMLIV